MSGFKKKTPAEELIESLLKDVGDDGASPEGEAASDGYSSGEEGESAEGEVDEATIQEFLGAVSKEKGGFVMASNKEDYQEKTENEYERTRLTSPELKPNDLKTSATIQMVDPKDLPNVPTSVSNLKAQRLDPKKDKGGEKTAPLVLANDFPTTDSIATQPLISPTKAEPIKLDIPLRTENAIGDNEKTVAVAGFQARSSNENFDDRVKVSVGQNRSSSSGYAVWGSGGGTAESNLAQADNLRIAQDKIIELETENEKLRLQNEELMAASEIIKERSDLLSSQLSEYKNDRDGLEESFKNEIVLLKNHLAKKDSEFQKAVLKSEELESRLKFDMKKIRVRERELENRLELVRAEKNAVVKNKDEQILDLRRKMDVLQMEVESYRQKCVELNKLLETNQESFKRTTRALRLAMANLELQEENKVPLKKAE